MGTCRLPPEGGAPEAGNDAARDGTGTDTSVDSTTEGGQPEGGGNDVSVDTGGGG
jgi:hypothetical protein